MATAAFIQPKQRHETTPTETMTEDGRPPTPLLSKKWSEHWDLDEVRRRSSEEATDDSDSRSLSSDQDAIKQHGGSAAAMTTRSDDDVLAADLDEEVDHCCPDEGIGRGDETNEEAVLVLAAVPQQAIAAARRGDPPIVDGVIPAFALSVIPAVPATTHVRPLAVPRVEVTRSEDDSITADPAAFISIVDPIAAADEGAINGIIVSQRPSGSFLTPFGSSTSVAQRRPRASSTASSSGGSSSSSHRHDPYEGPVAVALQQIAAAAADSQQQPPLTSDAQDGSHQRVQAMIAAAQQQAAPSAATFMMTGNVGVALLPGAAGSAIRVVGTSMMFTPPPPPTPRLIEAIEADTDEEILVVLRGALQRWCDRIERWIAHHPKERPAVPLPQECAKYPDPQSWLNALNLWYQANFAPRCELLSAKKTCKIAVRKAVESSSSSSSSPAAFASSLPMQQHQHHQQVVAPPHSRASPVFPGASIHAPRPAAAAPPASVAAAGSRIRAAAPQHPQHFHQHHQMAMPQHEQPQHQHSQYQTYVASHTSQSPAAAAMGMMPPTAMGQHHHHHHMPLPPPPPMSTMMTSSIQMQQPWHHERFPAVSHHQEAQSRSLSSPLVYPTAQHPHPHPLQQFHHHVSQAPPQQFIPMANRFGSQPQQQQQQQRPAAFMPPPGYHH